MSVLFGSLVLVKRCIDMLGMIVWTMKKEERGEEGALLILIVFTGLGAAFDGVPNHGTPFFRCTNRSIWSSDVSNPLTFVCRVQQHFLSGKDLPEMHFIRVNLHLSLVINSDGQLYKKFI